MALIATNQWMAVFLAVPIGHHSYQTGEGRAGVTVERVVNGEIKHIVVKRVHETIVRLEDGGKAAHTDADGCVRLTNGFKLLSLSLHVISPSITSYAPTRDLSFPKMEAFLLDVP